MKGREPGVGPRAGVPPASSTATTNHRLYVVACRVPRRTDLTVGALGSRRLARGWYAYVGSARRGRDARVARHFHADKPRRWHADYLFAVCPPTHAWLVDGLLDECALVEWLMREAGALRAVAGFGSGDCRCAGHLLRLPARKMLDARLLELGARRSRPRSSV